MILMKPSDVMRFKVSDMLLSALCFIFCAGCSVKENRNLCPCLLRLDFSEVDTASVNSMDIFVRGGGDLVLSDVVGKENFSEDYLAYVPRTTLQLCAWAGRGDALTDDLKIPYGEDCPPVYIHSSRIDAVSESVSETLILRKNFCSMTLNVRMTVQSAVGLLIIGNVDGYGSDGRPSQGDFMVALHPDEKDVFCVSLPRQIDDSLVMELDTGDEVVKRFPIGLYIAESGYDWNAPELEDITIDMDFALTHLSVMIRGWEKEYKFDVVI